MPRHAVLQGAKASSACPSTYSHSQSSSCHATLHASGHFTFMHACSNPIRLCHYYVQLLHSHILFGHRWLILHLKIVYAASPLQLVCSTEIFDSRFANRRTILFHWILFMQLHHFQLVSAVSVLLFFRSLTLLNDVQHTSSGYHSNKTMWTLIWLLRTCLQIIKISRFKCQHAFLFLAILIYQVIQSIGLISFCVIKY